MYPRTYAQYTLLERLATGGMSEVDLARRSIEDADYVRFLVIKRIRANHVEDDAFVRMFKDEARITSELRHTHIAQVYDFGRVDDEYYLALEYVPGTDLRAILRRLKARGEKMPVRMVLKFAADVLGALHYAHTRTDPLGQPMRIVHRDVNPRNVMVSVAGEVKLIDFGVARATDRLERTQTDHFKGKIAYMAPEQVQGRDLDHRADIFAMGLTMYEMLAGQGAFSGLDQTQILYKLIQGELPRLEVPRAWGAAGRELRTVVDRALAHEPDGRFPDADAMRQAVEQVAEAFGGMPDQAELGAWLATVEPELEDQVREKMKSWSGPLPEPRPTEELTAPSSSTSSTIERGSLGSPTGSSMTANVMVAAGVGTVGLGALAVVVGTAVVVVGVGWWWLSPVSPPPVPVQAPVAQIDEPAAEARVEPISVGLKNRRPDEDDAVAVAAPRPTRSPQRAAPEASEPDAPSPPDDVPVPDDAASDATSGDDAGADAGSTDGEGSSEVDVAPELPPEPAAVATGRLQVTATKKGVEILIDGKPSGHRTGDEFRWPVGTYTVSAVGFSPKTVSVRENMVQFVPLKP